MTRSITTLVLLMGLTIALFGADRARAEDQKRYAGSECVRWSGGSLGYWWSAITAPSAAISVDCPIVRDSFVVSDGRTETTWGILNRAEVSFIDQNAQERFRCSLVAVSLPAAGRITGFSVGASNWDELASSSSNVQVMEFDGSRKKIEIGDHAYLSCRIPAAYYGGVSSLNSYWIKERS